MYRYIYVRLYYMTMIKTYSIVNSYCGEIEVVINKYCVP